MNEENRRLLVEGARSLGVELSAGMVLAFERHRALLAEWGRAMALTAIRDERAVVLLHFLDSLSVVPRLPAAGRVADLGSGAGFPGIPVKIARPDLDVALFEPNRKKAAFLKTVVRDLGLEGADVVDSRVEEAARQPRFAGTFDVVTARAFGPPGKTAMAGRGLLGPGGHLVLMLGRERDSRDALGLESGLGRFPLPAVWRGVAAAPGSPSAPLTGRSEEGEGLRPPTSRDGLEPSERQGIQRPPSLPRPR